MNKKSLLNKIVGKNPTKASGVAEVGTSESVIADSSAGAGEVDHLWMKEDLNAEKPKLEKDPRIDTGILRNRIADKIAKMNNH